jgi:hypothetical protein
VLHLGPSMPPTVKPDAIVLVTPCGWA